MSPEKCHTTLENTYIPERLGKAFLTKANTQIEESNLWGRQTWSGSQKNLSGTGKHTSNCR